MDSINCIVETPKGCGAKYNFEPKLGCIELGKVLPAGLVFPFDFGYIPGTTGEDGDPLDVIIISEAPSFPGCGMKCRIIGAVKAMQRERNNDEMRNDRYMAVPEVSVLYKDITEVKKLPAQILDELENFFINYNRQAGKDFKPLGWIDADEAIKAINKAQETAKPARLIQLLLPLYNNNEKPFPEKYFHAVEKKLIEEFGGVTAYTQSPAAGLWKEEKDKLVKDKLVIYEVMVSRIDRSFWEKYKTSLEKQFGQKELVIRQMGMGLL